MIPRLLRFGKLRFSVKESTSHLGITYLLIFRAAFKKLFVLAATDDSSVIQYENQITVLDRAHPLCHCYNG